MKNSKEIIEEVKNLSVPNKGVKALAQRAWDDPDFCIMDNDTDCQTYRRKECPDCGACHKFRLYACLFANKRKRRCAW